MSIKKAYTDIVELLQANLTATVEDILPSVIELASAKAGGGGGRATTFHKDEDGNTVAIKCFYFGKWMLTDEVEFGKKASSATGLNSMCKEGVSLWTKQQSIAKKAKDTLLTAVAAGELDASDLAGELAAIEEARNVVEEFSGPCYDTLEEALA